MKATSKITKLISVGLAVLILLTSCGSTTMIQSVPNGAKLYLNGEYTGVTPHTHKDTKVVGTTTTVRLEKDGYETFNGVFQRNEQADVGAIIGGVFLLVPFLWTMKYNPSRTYELQPSSGVPMNNTTQKVQPQQFQEVVYLKNGSIIRGTIIEQVPGKSLKIQTVDGNVFVYEMEEVEKVAKEIQK